MVAVGWQFARFAAADPDALWIFKPSGGRRGRGAIVVR